MKRRSAISGFERPRAIATATSRSRGLSGSSRSGSGWAQRARLDFPSGVVGEFGADVALSDGQPVVAAKDDASAFVFTLAPPVSSEGAPEADLRLSAPAPNPASGRATLSLTEAPQRVRAAVYDAPGREVAVLWDGPVVGTVRLGVETATLAPGAYVVRVAGAGVAEARRLTVVR